MEIQLDLTSIGKWTVKLPTTHDLHNHPPSSTPAAHPTRRRRNRTDAMMQFVASGSSVGELVAATVATIKREIPGALITHRDISNLRQKVLVNGLEGKTRLQHLVDSMQTSTDYFCKIQCDPDGHLRHLFFAYLPAVEVFKTNHDVVPMDFTYKTNRFDMPLMNVVGVTGMNTAIHLAQCFFRNEKYDDYEWALVNLRELFVERQVPDPLTIFSDCEIALLNALEKDWRHVPSLLCLWHINIDVQAHARGNHFQRVLEDCSREKVKVRQP